MISSDSHEAIGDCRDTTLSDVPGAPRSKLIGDAIANGDEVTVNAFLTMPGAVLGGGDEGRRSRLEQQRRKMEWEKLGHGPKVARIAAIKSALGNLDRAERAKNRFLTELIDQKIVEAVEATRKRKSV